jgi:tetratricopeptide (TPR) repeat protein
MQARGHLHEATMRIDEVLAMSDEPTPYRAKALEAAGGIAWWRGDLEQSTLWYREATEICRTLDDPEELANSLYNYALAGAFGEMLDQQPAQEMLDQALDIYEKTANQAGLGDVHWGKANLELNRGDAKPSLVKSHLEAAASFYKEAGNDFGYGWSIFELGEHARRAGDLELAEAQLREGLHLFDDHGDLSGVVLFLSSLAAAALAAGNLQRAYRLAGAVQTLRLRTGTDLVIAAPNLVEGLEPETLEALPGETSAPYHLGKEMSVAEAVEYALD